MEFLLDNLDDLLEIILELIKLVYKFVVKRFLPFVVGIVGSIKHSIDMKKFKDDLDIKKENIKDGIKDLNERI